MKQLTAGCVVGLCVLLIEQQHTDQFRADSFYEGWCGYHEAGSIKEWRALRTQTGLPDRFRRAMCLSSSRPAP